MNSILHLTCSPRGAASESTRLSERIVELLCETRPGVRIVRRDLGRHALPHIDADYALAQHAASATLPATGSMLESDALIAELEDADVVVIATPMHNLGTPSVLKAWIDHVVRARRSFDIGPGGKVGLLRDRPVYVAVASGGRYSGERARQPDFLTPYLRTILATIGLEDLRFLSVQGTGLGSDALARARAEADAALSRLRAS